MNMISQFFILAPRGDVIIRKDYLGNVPRISSEIFFRHAKFWKDGDEAPPVFIVDGVTYLHVKEGGVILVATTRENVSPSFVLEFLKRIGVIIKDYCGMLNEDAIRKNFVLVYELLDEVIDYGLPQSTTTEALKTFVINDPVVVAPPTTLSKQLFRLTKGPTGVFKSVLDNTRSDNRKKDEIYVDVVERLTCTFNASGYLASSQIDGSVQIKSYLAGNPPIKVKFNDDITIGKRDNPYATEYEATTGVVLDDCNFHEVANLDTFDVDRTISLVPPDGEFALINYRSTQGFKPPFKLYTSVEADSNSELKANLTLRLWCELPTDKYASGLEIEVPTPKYVQRVHCDIDEKQRQIQSMDFNEKTHVLKWKFSRCGGGSDFMLRVRLTLERPYGPKLRSEIGPVNLKFTIPMYSCSKLALKYLQILKKDKGYNPHRWVRYITSSNSYTFRT